MIISNKPVQNVNKAYSESGKVSKSSSTSAGSTLQRPDEVILSPQAQEIRQTVADIKNLPDVRQDRVDELTEAIDSGSYNRAAADVAGAVWSYFRRN